ncbi:hypothetical protein [Helicobacter rodentium]|uniref:hypothetical protein n=1 Tax=Helicobacter rodentium TaxID=59617 RepID=UPI0025ED3B71|nr:hypothetical protein [Helicobacter rodentium]
MQEIKNKTDVRDRLCDVHQELKGIAAVMDMCAHSCQYGGVGMCQEQFYFLSNSLNVLVDKLTQVEQYLKTIAP